MRLITPFKKFRKVPVERQVEGKKYQHDYRGFSTSISHSFVYPREWSQDACSLACCGLLQKDRNIYLMTGETPPSCTYRFLAYVFLPLGLLIPGLYLVMRTRTSGFDYGLGITLLVAVAAYVSFQVWRSWSNPEYSRKQILMHKYKHIHGKLLEDDDSMVAEEKFLNGQTLKDLSRAHMLLGFYEDDVMYDDMEAPLPEECCGGIWQLLMGCCCGRFGNTYVQCCGICGVAQETRELNHLFPPHQRAVDYLTMQPVLDYYNEIIALRHNAKSTLIRQHMTLSKLSIQILVAFGLGFAATFFFCLVFPIWITQFALIVAVFTVATAFLYGVHLKFGLRNLSTDAIIKGFAAGFCIASTMSLPIIGTIGVLFQFAMYVFMRRDEAWYDDDNTFSNEAYVAPFLSLTSAVNGEFSRQFPVLHLACLFVQCFFVSAFVQELTKYLAFRMTSLHPDFWTNADLDKVADATYEEAEGDALVALNVLPDIPAKAQSRSVMTRCCTITAASIAVSVGVGCFDDLVYAALSFNLDFDWRILFFRLFLFSIHPVSAAWQALGICKFDVERNQAIQTGWIVVPAIFWHGLFNFSVLLGGFLVSQQLVGNNASVHAFIKYFLPFSILVSSLALVVFRFDALQSRLQGKANNESGDDAEQARDLANTWSWELPPTENKDLDPKKLDQDHVPFTQRRREARNGYGIHSIGRRGVELELCPTPNDEVFNKFGIRTVVTADMSVEEVIKKFGVLESSPLYTPPAITQNNSLPAVDKLQPPVELIVPAPITTNAAAPTHHPIESSQSSSPTKCPRTTTSSSSAYEDALTILQNRMTPTSVPVPKPAQNINHAATNSSNHLAAAMASLNKPIPKNNPYAAAQPPAASQGDDNAAAATITPDSATRLHPPP